MENPKIPLDELDYEVGKELFQATDKYFTRLVREDKMNLSLAYNIMKSYGQVLGVDVD